MTLPHILAEHLGDPRLLATDYYDLEGTPPVTRIPTLPDPDQLAAAVTRAANEAYEATGRLINLRLLNIAAAAVAEHATARYVAVYESDESRCVYPSDVYDVTGEHLEEGELTDDFACEGEGWAWIGFVAQAHPVPDLPEGTAVLDLDRILATVTL